MTTFSHERHLFTWAHPDDEYMNGYAVLQQPDRAHAIIATYGEASDVNYSQDPCFCC